MDRQQIIEDNDLSTQPKKEYRKPALTVLGKVSELTAKPSGEEGGVNSTFTDAEPVIVGAEPETAGGEPIE